MSVTKITDLSQPDRAPPDAVPQPSLGGGGTPPPPPKEQTVGAGASTPAEIVDIVDLLGSEINVSEVNELERARIGQSPCVLCLFTQQCTIVAAHYLELPEYEGYMRCNGANCLACKAERDLQSYILHPAYSLINRAIVVLSISSSRRPGSMAAGLSPCLNKLKATGKPVTIAASKKGKGFRIRELPHAENSDDGRDAVLRFQADFNDGKIDLASVFPVISNEELRQFESIRQLLHDLGDEDE